MSRELFGDWAADADDATFAAAAAAIGIAAAQAPERLTGTAEQVRDWWSDQILPRHPLVAYRWRSPLDLPGWDVLGPEVWAPLWLRLIAERHAIEVELDPGPIDEAWLWRLLNEPGGVVEPGPRSDPRTRGGLEFPNEAAPPVASEPDMAAPGPVPDMAAPEPAADAAPGSLLRRRERPPGDPADRWLQARISDAAGRSVTEFRPATEHEIRVRIAPHDADWLEAATPFPDDELPAGRPHRLTIVLTEPELLDAPLVDELVLPVSGPSTDCVFTLTTTAATASVDARLIVLSGNRVLQTARLPSDVLAPKRWRGIRRGPVQVAVPETVVGGAGAVGERRPFDAAFVVNHNGSGAAAATAVADGRAAVIDLDDTSISEAMHKLTGRLGEIVDQPEDFDSLTAPGTRELLVFLAHHGALLRSALVKDFLGETLAGATHLQVVSARPDAYFPFELAYEFPAPGEDAALCPEATASLANPDVAAGCPGAHDGSTVCPFGFWAISKVIERHAFQPGIDLPKSFLVRSQPTGDRNRISLGGESLVAVSDRVDTFTAGTSAELVDAIGAAAGHAARPATWKDWRDEVAGAAPSLLVLLPHTVHSDALDTFGLEIGSGDRAWAGDIDERFLPADTRPVIVALLGCDTAGAAQVGYERFPGILRRAGAEVVIATLTEVLGRHAAPVGAALAAALYACCADGPRSVGEVMVGLRRRLLGDGLIMVMALAVFGDADWLLERRS